MAHDAVFCLTTDQINKARLEKFGLALCIRLLDNFERVNSFDEWFVTACESGDWSKVASEYGVTHIILRGKIMSDAYRTPDAKVLFGESPWITVVENQIRYSLNIECHMFSKGNVTERMRMGSIRCNDEVVLDLFAGIGYFTLPTLVHGGAKFVHACDWNPVSIETLSRNLVVNKVSDRCRVYTTDSTKVRFEKMADRVILGLIPSSEMCWKVACRSLKTTGGVLHIHNNVESKMLPDNIQSLVCICGKPLLFYNTVPDQDNLDFCTCILSRFRSKKGLSSGTNNHRSLCWIAFCLTVISKLKCILTEVDCNYSAWSVDIQNVVCVKSYAPYVHHLVLDVLCSPASTICQST